MGVDIVALLRALREQGGSDLHLVSGSPPRMRVGGQLVTLDQPSVDDVDVERALRDWLGTEQRTWLARDRSLDYAIALEGLGRFRVHVYRQRGAVAMAIRAIPLAIPSFDVLGLPPLVDEVLKKPRGLILVTGPAGSGKSTSLAAMIDRINAERRLHILTIEEPIEFVHSHNKSMVSQREIGADVNDYPSALRSVLRQDPDVVCVGELRDRDTIEAALTIAETGHLTLATLHTNSCIQTIHRLIDVFPAHRHAQVRAQLALVLEGIFSQILIPRLDGTGRVLAVEVLAPTPAVRTLIRDDKVHQIYSVMQTGQAKHGMQTMNQALVDLVRRGHVSAAEALARSSYPDELSGMIDRAGSAVRSGGAESGREQDRLSMRMP